MALGEQFESRSITHTPEGSVGQRIFIADWHDRYSNFLPVIGQRWPADPLHAPAITEGLWLHEIIQTPYAASGEENTADNVATHVRLECNYRSSIPLSSASDSWLISTNSTIQAVDGGRGRTFVASGNNMDASVPRYSAMTEIVIRGLEDFGPTEPSLADLAGPTSDAEPVIGTVCAEQYGGNGPVGQVLFESEDTGEAFMRTTDAFDPDGSAGHASWYRTFSRRFLLKRIRYGPARLLIAGHLQEYDTLAGTWDTVNPGLYETANFSAIAGDPPVFPF